MRSLHPLFLALLLAAALAVRVLVPTGFMPVAGAGGVTLQLCPGTMPVPVPVPAPMAGMHHAMAHDAAHGGKSDEAPAKAEQPCAFAGLAAPALGAADPLLLAAALVFAFVLAVRAAGLALPRAPARLRPPLRAPPLPA